MTKVFAKILCPVDFDQASGEAVDMACKLAELQGSTLYLLHVVATPRLDQILLEPPHPIMTESVARTELKKLASRHLESRVRYQLVVRTGDPAVMIVAVAEEFAIDLIVMATHSGRELTRLLFGSVAERVIHETRRPVLNLRPQPSNARPISR
jgi:nucleotide-binding universal stress UspA family protein